MATPANNTKQRNICFGVVQKSTSQYIAIYFWRGWVVGVENRADALHYQVIVNELFADGGDEGLPETTDVHLADHATSVHPVTLVLPQQQQAALVTAWL